MIRSSTEQRRLVAVVPEYLPERHLEMLDEHLDVVYDHDLYEHRQRLLPAVSGASALLIRNRTIVDEELLSVAKSLRVIGRLGVGLDNIDLEAVGRHGVALFPAHGGNAVSVAEYVMGAMLILFRGVYDMTPSMKRGEWPRQGHAFGRELHGKTLGLVGFGNIARQVGSRAGTFGMRVLAHDPYIPIGDHAWSLAAPMALEDLLGQSDVVSIHVPLDEHTRLMIDEAAIASMKRDSILINTSRGGIVDEEALTRALAGSEIAGAALDVFDHEPLDPEAADRFAHLDNILLTPHIAGNTRESVDRVATMTVSAVLEELGLTSPAL